MYRTHINTVGRKRLCWNLTRDRHADLKFCGIAANLISVFLNARCPRRLGFNLFLVRSRVEVSVRRPNILTDVFPAFYQLRQDICRYYTLKLCHDRFLPYPLQFIISFNSTLNNLTASLNKS